jgi:hypothetical protein
MLFCTFTATDLVYGTEFWRQCLHHVEEILVTIYEVQDFKIAIAAARFLASIVPECKSEEASHPAAPQRHP